MALHFKTEVAAILVTFHFGQRRDDFGVWRQETAQIMLASMGGRLETVALKEVAR